MSFDVFISYATKDKTVADAVCARLESVGVRCWIAPRDIVASTSYGEAIIDAIHSAKLMVLVFSANANASAHIPKEVERAVSHGVPILPFRIEDIAPGKSLDYFIGSVHWLDAMTPPMEQHLDQLAATVNKLLPAVTGEARPSAAPGSGSWQQRGASVAPPPTAPPTVPSTAATAAAGIASPRASSKKKLWITAGGVIAFLVLMAILFGRSGNSENRAQTASGTNPPADPGGATDTNPGSTLAKPDSHTAPTTPAAKTSSSRDPLVGCYQWFNNAPVVVHSDGTIYGGPFKGRWQMLNSVQRTYRFMWPEDAGAYTLSPDQRTLSGASMYGFSVLASRTAGSGGFAGTWRWPNGALVTVFTNGTFMCGPFNGTWKTIDASRGTYTMTWPGPIDTVALDPSGTRVTGTNQYGVTISGVRTEPCKTN